MKSLFVGALVVVSLAACQKDKEAQPTVIEYADWYALRAPDDRAIEAVAGDIDGTLTITTSFTVYQTKDRGKTWQTGDYANRIGIRGFYQQQDTLLALAAGGGYGSNTNTEYALSPEVFSLNQGLTWQRYRDWRPSLALRVKRNRATAATGTEYSIEYQETPVGPNSSTVYIDYLGVQTSTGQHLTLPQQHQLKSLYFDAKSRLYIAASAPLCGQGRDFKFCGDQKGTLYISKQPRL
ncbi:hypothetical protein [Hymenobacter actinosclerus]|uniref:Lipoprotein n=1 Tax=Hymenobacter actinosclerus TaxID=82805 RepID=A0A1H9ZPR3_9BACT|nr:hypothetical protein [Hymenobacter actinosclerus]SES83666.1 hypothetical protein SAMN04487998_0422 [Hymenobacter actinosclerus]